MNKQELREARQARENSPEYKEAAAAYLAHKQQFSFMVADIMNNPSVLMDKANGIKLWPYQPIEADYPPYVEQQRLFKVMCDIREGR